jgi:hypothetical protein
MAETNRPVSAFVTIESEIMFNIAQGLQEIQIFGSNSKVKKAADPSDIIWENQGVSKVKQSVKLGFGLMVVLGVFAATYTVLFFAKNIQISLIDKYDSSMACSQIH